MTASRACFFIALVCGLCATTARAAIVISTDEVWDGVANPHAADGVTLNNGVYTIPTSVTIAAGVNVYLNNPLGSTPSNSVTWEFLPGAGGLTFGDPTSTIDTYVGGRNLAPTTFTLNMNNNNIGGSVPGAGRIINAFALIDMESGDSMSVAINSQANVVMGEIDVTKIDATFSAINVVSQGLVNIGRLADRDTSAGGGSTFDINIRGETLVLGDIDTRNARVPTSNSEIGNVNLRALAQPENSTGAFTANTAAVNSVTLKGLIRTNGPSSPNNKGNINVTAVKVELTPTFNVDLNETGTFNVTAGAVGPGFPQSALFVNNSPVTPTSVVYTVFHDNLGPTDIEWDSNASGNWHNDNNWSVVGFPANSNAIPNSNTQTAIFGSAITAPQTIYMNTATTAKGVRFNTASKVAVAGTTGITMDANTGSASLEVQQGSHEVQVPLTLNDPTNVTTAAGTQLDLNGIINMQGNTLTVSGAGQVNVNNQVTGGGSISSSGTLGWTDGSHRQPDEHRRAGHRHRRLRR
jgi:hypothetical protein